MGAYRVDDTMVGSGASSETRRVSLMSSEMFALLGVKPMRGRFYDAAEDADNVAVISESYWRTTLGADPNVIGKTVAIDAVPHTIVGIAPVGFTGPEFRRVDVWTPIKIAQRRSMNVQIVARLKPDATSDEVVGQLTRSRSQIEAVLPSWAGFLRGGEYLASPISYDATARAPFEAVMARWLAAISALILFSSCANVANLLLARLARRRRELAVRIALGSGRGRVMRLLAIEGLLLAVGAAALAFVVIVLIQPVVQGALFPSGSWAFSLFDVRIIGAVAALTLVTGMLVSVAPAIQAGRRDVNEMLHGGNRDGEVRSPLRSGLTIVQAMLSVVLLVGAGLFLRSVARVNATDLGMDPDRVLLVEVRYPRIPRGTGESVADWGKRLSATDRERHRVLIDVARLVPGVEKAAVAIGVPFFEGFSEGLWIPGRDSIPELPGGGPYLSAVGTDYFASIGTAIRRGRAFSADDNDRSEAVAIVSETMARTVWPREDALGKCVRVGSRDAPCARVVGIAADAHSTGLREEPSMQVYVPIGQERGFSGSWLVVRPSGAVSPAWPALRAALQKSDQTIQAIDVRRLSQGLDGEMRPIRLGMLAFGSGASLAVIVAALGLYSIMAHAVAWRRHEIGVRLALGARPRSIATLIVGRGAVLATIGIGLGLLVAFAARTWVEPLLFNTSATDPLVFVGVAAVLEAMALLAGWLPAQRAVSVSPTEALRAE
jgi:predicted permease